MQQWQVTSLENSGTSKRKFIVCSQIPSVVVVDKKYITPKWKPFQTQTGMSNAKISKWYTHTHAVTGWLASRKKLKRCLHSSVLLACSPVLSPIPTGPTSTVPAEPSWHPELAKHFGFQKQKGGQKHAKTAVVREIYSIKGLLISMVARLSACHWCLDMRWCSWYLGIVHIRTVSPLFSEHVRLSQHPNSDCYAAMGPAEA